MQIEFQTYLFTGAVDQDNIDESTRRNWQVTRRHTTRKQNSSLSDFHKQTFNDLIVGNENNLQTKPFNEAATGKSERTHDNNKDSLYETLVKDFIKYRRHIVSQCRCGFVMNG